MISLTVVANKEKRFSLLLIQSGCNFFERVAPLHNSRGQTHVLLDVIVRLDVRTWNCFCFFHFDVLITLTSSFSRDNCGSPPLDERVVLAIAWSHIAVVNRIQFIVADPVGFVSV